MGATTMAAARHVILTIIDGLRPDAIAAAPMPCLQQLQHDYWSATGYTVRPSITVAALTSLATGVSPEQHGLTEAALPPLGRVAALRPLPVELRRQQMQSTVVVGDLPGSKKLLARTLLSMGGVGGFVSKGREPVDIARAACETFRRTRPAFTALYLDHCDVAGHADGWMSPGYLAAATRADAAVQEVAALLADEDVLLLFVADHGGGGVEPLDHDIPHPVNDAIPVVAAGRMVARGASARPVSILDIPATILTVLGAAVPSAYEGTELPCFVREAVGV
jgi:predicted AlkP superfamily pyrophosphatase or phosphodiesterase